MATGLRDAASCPVCPVVVGETRTVTGFDILPPPKPRACDRCGALTFLRFCDACASAEETRAQTKAALKALDASVPENFRGLDAAHDRVRCISAVVRAAALTLVAEPIVVLVGPSAARKTTLAVAMLRARVEATGRPSLFVRAWQLGIARIQHAAGDGEAKSVDEAMTAPHVLLDDVGSERQTATNAVPDVILRRSEEGLPTWITTWLTPQQAAEKYGGGVARRIFEQAKVLNMNAASRPEARP